MTGTNVAALGDAMAHNNLSILYRKGDGAEKDEKKIEESIPALEEAAFAIAIASHPEARYNLLDIMSGERKGFLDLEQRNIN